MASHQLEYQAFPDVAPTGAPSGDFEHIETSPAMFGGAVAGAEEKLGQGVESVGTTGLEVLHQRQLFENQVHGAELNTDTAKKFTGALSDFSQYQGRQARDHLAEYNQRIDDIASQALAATGSLQEKAMVAGQLRYLQDRYAYYGVSHADQQFNQYTKKVAEDQVETYSNQAGVALLNNDRAGFATNLRLQDDEVRNQWEHSGYDPQTIEREVEKARGKTLATSIESYIKATNDINGAGTLFDQYADKIDPASRKALLTYLRPALNQQQYQIGADIAIGRQPSREPFSAPEQGAGIPQGYISRVIHLESGGDPNAQTGKYQGLGQFGPAEMKKYGITDPGDVTQVSNALLTEAEENRRPLAVALGRNPSPSELYIAHQQGQAGAAALFSNPDRTAWQAIRKFYGSDQVAKNAIWGNMTDSMKAQFPGGVDTVKSGDFANLWRDRYQTPGTQGAQIIDKESAYRRNDEMNGNNPIRWRGVKTIIDREYNDQQVIYSQRRAELSNTAPQIIDGVRNGNVTLALPDDIGLLGNAQAEKYKEQYNSALREGQARRSMVFASPQEVGGMADSLANAPGDIISRQQDTSAFAKAVQERDKLLHGEKADPGSYVLQQPDVNAKFKAVDPKNPASFEAFATASLGLQTHMGLRPDEQHLLGRDGAVKMADNISNSPDPKAAIDQLRAQTGNAWTKVFHDLATMGKLPAGYQALSVLDEKNAGQLGRWLSDTAKEMREKDKGIEQVQSDLVGKASVNDIKQAVNTNPSILDLEHSLYTSGSSRQQIEDIKHSVVQLAFAKAMDREPNAAKAAVTAFTSQYEFMPNGGARIPATNAPAIYEGARSVLNTIDENAISNVPSYYVSGNEPNAEKIAGRPRASEYAELLRASPQWITHGNEIWLMDSQGRIPLNKQGRPFSVPFNIQSAFRYCCSMNNFVDFVPDGSPYQPPEGAQAQGYQSQATAASAFGAGVLSTVRPLTSFLQRGVYEGGVGGAIARGLISAGETEAGVQPGESAIPSDMSPVPTKKMLTAAEANEGYAPIGPDGKTVNIADGPMPIEVAENLGKVRKDNMDREDILNRFAQSHSWPTRFAVNSVSFMMDPLNASSMFMPGIGEDAALVAAGKFGLSGVAARTAGRVIAGSTAATAGMVPIEAARYGLAKSEGEDWSIRDAAFDLMTTAAFGAAIHAGVIGGFKEINQARIGTTPIPKPIIDGKPVDGTEVLTADPMAVYAGMRASVSQILDGRPVDVLPIFNMDNIRRTSELAGLRQQESTLAARLGELPEGRAESAEKLARVEEVERQLSAETDVGQRRVLSNRRDELLAETTPEQLRIEAAPIEQRRQIEAQRDNVTARIDQLEREGRQAQVAQFSDIPKVAIGQRQLWSNGFAQGIPQAEFDRVNAEIYGPKPPVVEAKPVTNAAGEKVDPDVAIVEQQLAGMQLHPEDQVEVQAARAEEAQSTTLHEAALNEAANCMQGL